MATLLVKGQAIDDVALVVFDKDGTLIDLYHYWSRMIDYRAQKICDLFGIAAGEHKAALCEAMGVDLKLQRIKKEGPVGLHPRTVVQKAAEAYLAARGIKDAAQKCTDAFLMADEYSMANLSRIIKPIDGVIPLIKQLKRQGLKIALGTSDKKERALLTLEILKVKDDFDVVVGFDMIKNPKPAPDTLQYINKQLGIKPVNSVMIGDIYADLEMGDKAGYRASIALKSNVTDEERLRAMTPYVIEQFAQITLKE